MSQTLANVEPLRAQNRFYLIDFQTLYVTQCTVGARGLSVVMGGRELQLKEVPCGYFPFIGCNAITRCEVFYQKARNTLSKSESYSIKK